jgi:hypothetical protein
MVDYSTKALDYFEGSGLAQWVVSYEKRQMFGTSFSQCGINVGIRERWAKVLHTKVGDITLPKKLAFHFSTLEATASTEW